MKTLEYYFKKAKKEKWAIGQFNFSNLETLKGIIQAAENMQSVIILGTSESESKFIGLGQAKELVRFWRKETGLPIFLNLDHGKSFEYTKKAIDKGYDMVQFDGSKLSFKQNIKITKKVVNYARKKGVLVEGELGKIKKAEDFKNITKDKKDFTDINNIEEFVKKTNIDCLAVSIGNVHGISKEMPELDLEKLKKIKKITKAYLVLHGGSGISEKEIKKAITIGINKININTELRIIWRKALEKSLKRDYNENKSYKILPLVIRAIQKRVEEKIKLFGSVNRV